MYIVNEQVLKFKELDRLMRILKITKNSSNDIKKIISYQDFSRLLKKIIENIMKNILLEVGELYDSYSCQIKEMAPFRKGEFIYKNNQIIINEQVVKKLYLGNVLELITIFHELNHFQIKYQILNGDISYDLVRITKELFLNLIGLENNNKFILDLNPFVTYYKDNYKFFSEEKIVNIRSIYDLKVLLKYFGIELSKIEQQLLFDLLEREKHDYQNYIRDVRHNYNFNSYFIDFEKAFDIMIKDYPKWLEFPQLQIEYYLDEFGNVKKRTKEELIHLLEIEQDDNKQEYIKKLIDGNQKKRLDKTVFDDTKQYNSISYKKLKGLKNSF